MPLDFGSLRQVAGALFAFTQSGIVETQRVKWVAHLQKAVLTPSGRRRFVGLLADGARGAGCDLACSTQGRHMQWQTAHVTDLRLLLLLHNVRSKVHC